MPVKLIATPESDKEFRDAIRAQVEGQVRALSRERIEEILFDAAQKKINKNFTDTINSFVRDEVHSYSWRSEFTKKIESILKEYLRDQFDWKKIIESAMKEIYGENLEAFVLDFVSKKLR